MFVLVHWLGEFVASIGGQLVHPGDVFEMDHDEAESRGDVEIVEPDDDDQDHDPLPLPHFETTTE